MNASRRWRVSLTDSVLDRLPPSPGLPLKMLRILSRTRALGHDRGRAWAGLAVRREAERVAGFAVRQLRTNRFWEGRGILTQWYAEHPGLVACGWYSWRRGFAEGVRERLGELSQRRR